MSGLILLLDCVDERLFHAVLLRRRPRLDLFMRLITRLADPAVAIALAGGLAAGVVPALARAGRVAFATMVLSHLLVQLLKRTISRARPSLPVGFDSLIRAPDRFSFPSGHSAAGLSVFLPLALVAPFWLGVPLLLLGMAVGASRSYLGVHYPGDVLAGWLLALASMAVLV
ncbi:MAG TPA: phosphatase PAP2 family protein [Longimicrobiales bacterium]